MIVIENGQSPMTWSNDQDKLAKGEMQPIPLHP